VVLPAEAARESVPRPEVLYSVAFLKGTPEDYPGHFPETGSREAMMPAIEEPRERISPLGMRETACEVVRMLLERGFGGGEGSDCELSGQTLRVRATPDVHEKVAAFLAGLREHEGRTVQVTFQFLQMDDALLTRLLGTGRLAWEALSPEQVKALQAGIEKGEAKSVKRASLVAFQGQTVSSSAVRQVTYVCDYDVEVAQAAQIGDPIVAMIREGMVAQVVPVVFGDGRRILLDVRSAVAKILEPMESFATPHGAVSLPRVDFQRIGTSLILNDGGSVLLGGAGNLAVGKSLVLWLQAGLPETGREGAAPAAVHDRLLRVFDLRDLTHRIPDHAGPEVGLVVGSEEGGAGAAFMDAVDDPQAGERYDPGMIRSLVMERVYPESWDEGANFAELVLGHLVVVNRREALAKIEGLLAEMRERRVRGVEVVTRFLSIPTADLAPVLEQGAKEKGRAFLSPEQAGKILALADRDPAARLSTTVFPLFHKQRASLQTGRSIPYVRDLDVEVAQNAAVGDPITGRLLEGTFLDYRAEIDPAEDEATLELRPTLALLKKMTVSDVGGGRIEEGKKGEGQEGPLQPPLVGRIMLPELELQKIRATLTLRNGSTALLFCPSEAGADSGRDLVLLVSVRTMGTGKK
jgi:hypothetical protein